MKKIKPNEQNQLNVKQLHSLIEGKEVEEYSEKRSKKSKETEDENENEGPELFTKISKAILKITETENINLKTIFRQFDLDNDHYISFNEFQKAVKQRLKFSEASESSLQKAFNKFDVDKDFQISETEFQNSILNLKGVDLKKLLKQVRKEILSITSDENELLEIFKKIDRDNSNSLSQNEFAQGLQKQNLKLTGIELMNIYQYFDKDKKDSISYNHFVEVLYENHLDIARLRNKINESLNSSNTNFSTFFRKQGVQEPKQINRKEFETMMKKLGFDYDEQQLEELFAFIDTDKDQRICEEEFNEVLFGQYKRDVKPYLEKIRKTCKSEDLDIAKEFSSIDKQGKGTLSFFD